MALVYNSGLWQMQSGVVSHDFRLFAVGWQLNAGSLKQDSASQYTYTDGAGAQHRLYCVGVCTGKEGRERRYAVAYASFRFAKLPARGSGLSTGQMAS